MKRSWILFIAAAALIGCGGEKYLLRLNLKEGQQFKLRFFVESTASGTEAMDIMTLWKVIEARDKEYTVQMTIEDVRAPGLPLNPQALQTIKNIRYVTVYDEYGKTKSKKVENAPPGSSASQFTESENLVPLYPAHEVTPGDTWDFETSFRGRRITFNIHFEGVKKLEGRDTFYFVFELSEDHPELKFIEPIRMWIDCKDGFLVRMQFRAEDPSRGEGVRMTMERL